MTNSQVKQAIDETIGREPLMDEAFVQKVMQKRRRKKPLSILQPAIVLVFMLAIGAALYFTPSQSEHSAIEIKEEFLTDEQTKLIDRYYSAILNKDKNALAKVATISSQDVIERYSNFDLTKPLEVVKTIDAEKELMLFIKLQSDTEIYLDKLLLNKQSNKLELGEAFEFTQYEQEIELPKEITLSYKLAPKATPMKKADINLENAEVQVINGNSFYQLETKEGMKRIFETISGERFDLGIVSEGISYYSANNNNIQFNFIDSLTNMVTFVYLNKQGDYQIITGELGEQGGFTSYQTEFHKEPFIFTGGNQPRVITIQNGQLVYADIFEQADFENPTEFYSIENFGKLLLVKYTEDLKQTSTYYELTSMTVYKDSRLRNMLIAEPVHLQTMLLTNRYISQITYQFDDGTLYYRNDSRFYNEKPKTEDEKAVSGELIEETYTNIKIETENNQYFITGNNGFSWTLTRTAPRILQDEKGIEYIVPIDLDELSEHPK